MAFLTREKVFTVKWLKTYLLILIASVLIAAGYVFFMNPYRIVPGGVYGITIIFHNLFGTPLGLFALIFNIPLTFLGVKILGPRYGIKTVTGFVLTSSFMDLFSYYHGDKMIVEGDALLSCLAGGVVIGTGLFLLFKSKATCGGTDMAAMILSKLTGLQVGQLMIVVDSLIVFGGFIAFGDWKIPLYSLIGIFVMGRVVDTLLQGLNHDKTLMIISEKNQMIQSKLINDLKRGGTFLKGEGMYQQQKKDVIFTVVNRRELAMLQEFISQTDPEAFMVVINANEILGNGFKSLAEKVDKQ